MSFGKKSSPPPAPVAETPTVAPVQDSSGEDRGRPGARRVKRYTTADRPNSSVMTSGSETGGDGAAGSDPMGGGRKRIDPRRQPAMLG